MDETPDWNEATVEALGDLSSPEAHANRQFETEVIAPIEEEYLKR